MFQFSIGDAPTTSSSTLVKAEIRFQFSIGDAEEEVATIGAISSLTSVSILYWRCRRNERRESFYTTLFRFQFSIGDADAKLVFAKVWVGKSVSILYWRCHC